MTRSSRFLVAVILCVPVVQAAAAPAADTAGGAAFLGVASCSSAVCHGSLVAREGGNILRNEYVTWVEKDRHSRAYDALLGETSRAIAGRLGIGAAHEAALCLDCHAPVPPASLRGPKFSPTDGVSCESCHGAAGGWLESHDNPGRTREDHVAAGMTDLADAQTRAGTCASCHVGDGRRFVSHRIMAAGHPRLGFELDTFSYIQPRHYRVDEDYRRRKEAPSPVVLWATGQSALVGASLEHLLSIHRPGWPEFALFDCFSCHHPLRDQGSDEALEMQAGAPGSPALLRASAAMLALAAEAAALPADARIDPTLLGLDAALASGSERSVTLASQALARTRRGQELFNRWKPTTAQLHKLLAALCAPATTAAYRSYGDAEQASMAVQAVVASLIEQAALSAEHSARLRRAIDALFDATRSDAAFRRDTFLAAMRKVDSAR